MKSPIGIIGIASDELRQDLPRSLAALRALGYSGIEWGATPPIGLGPDAFAAALRDAGLTLITIHTVRHQMESEPGPALDLLAATGCKHLTISWSAADSMDAIRSDADFHAATAERLAPLGTTLCYHHHDHELTTRFNGKTALDAVLDACPALALHADVAWATFGGVQPAALLERHSGRTPLVHLKDLYDRSVRGCFTALGTGLVDIAGSVAAAIASGARWLTVEQDKPRRLSGMDLAKASMLNLRELGIEPA